MPPKTKTKKSSIGARIMTPININSDTLKMSKNQFSEMKERIQRGPLTLVFIHAQWCSHCHHFEPIFDKSVRSKKRSVQVIKLDEKNLESANEYIRNNINSNASLHPSGYPSLILIDKNANDVASVKPIPDSKIITEVIENAGKQMEAHINEQSEAATKGDDISMLQNTPITNTEQSGGLFAAITKTAYTLAPPAILMGIASRIFKKSKRQTHKRHLRSRQRSKRKFD